MTNRELTPEELQELKRILEMPEEEYIKEFPDSPEAKRQAAELEKKFDIDPSQR